jgi:cob(I)alamin adenosyltransferase
MVVEKAVNMAALMDIPVLGLVENCILTVDELKALLDYRDETDVIMTGATLQEEVCELADEVSKIETLKYKV